MSLKISVGLTTAGRGVQTGDGPVLLQALAGGGIPARCLGPEEAADVHLWLAGEGWEKTNLAALVARARASPGTEFLVVRRHGIPVARALAGVRASALDAPPRRLPRPGWHPRLVLLDRDGTLIVDRHYLKDPALVTLLPGAVAGLRLLREHHIPAAVVTNQSGVARGLISLADLEAVHDHLSGLLECENLKLAGIFFCPHAPEAGCRCRKPAPGLAEQAGSVLGIPLSHALVAGDRSSDIGLAHGIGVPAVLIAPTGAPLSGEDEAVQPDYLVDDLDELARIVTHPAGLFHPAPTA